MELHYIMGLWKADRCSTARGVVGIKNTQKVLLDKFQKFVEDLGMKPKFRQVTGFSTTQDIYVCNSRLRKEIEELFQNRASSSEENILAYFGGRIDGDGTISAKESHFRIYYSPEEKSEAEEDSEILKRLGIDSLVKMFNIPTLEIHKPRKFAKMISKFVVSPQKQKELKLLSA